MGLLPRAPTSMRARRRLRRRRTGCRTSSSRIASRSSRAPRKRALLLKVLNQAKSRGPRSARARPLGLFLVLPALFFLADFLVYPVLNLVYLSLNEYSPLSSAATTWVGARNFIVAASEPATLASIRTTIVFTLASVLIEVVLGL